MKVQVDAAKLAEILAKEDATNFVYTLNTHLSKEVIDGHVSDMLDAKSVASDDFSDKIRTLYRKQLDYYFEIITNHAL